MLVFLALRRLDADAARQLARHVGSVSLPAIESISAEAAEAEAVDDVARKVVAAEVEPVEVDSAEEAEEVQWALWEGLHRIHHVRPA